MFRMRLRRSGSASKKVELPPRMHAAVLESHGGIETLRVKTLPLPEHSMHEVLVRTRSFAVSRLDCEIRRNDRETAGLCNRKGPLGFAVSGTAVRVGSRVTHIQEGEPVFGLTAFPGCGGGYAGYALLPLETAQRIPKSLAAPEAAGVPLAGLVAYQALFNFANVKSRSTVLVMGAAGAIGHFAVQLAASVGATVVAVGSKRNHAFLRSLGAAAVADYKSESELAALPECDVAIDPVGGSATAVALSVLSRAGLLVSLSKAGADMHDELRISSRRIRRYRLNPRRGSFEGLCRLVESGAVIPTVMRVRGLEELPHAHALSESGHARGSIVCDLI